MPMFLLYTTSRMQDATTQPLPFVHRSSYHKQLHYCWFLLHMAQRFLGSRCVPRCPHRDLGWSVAESFLAPHTSLSLEFALRCIPVQFVTNVPTCQAWTGSIPIRLFCPSERIYRPTRHLLWHQPFGVPSGLLKRRSCLLNTVNLGVYFLLF